MLWGVALRSPHASARIRSIDVSAARRHPGVVAVLLAADVPGTKTFGLEFSDQPVLATTSSATTASRSRSSPPRPASRRGGRRPDRGRLRAARRSSPTWSPRSRPDSPLVHGFGNVLRHVHIVHGDLGSAEADVSVEGVYETAMQDQASLGPEAGLAVPDGDGGVDLYVATQWLHVDRRQIAPCLGLPEELVRITSPASAARSAGARTSTCRSTPPARAAHRQAREDVLRPRGVVQRPRPPPSVAHLDPLRRDPRRAGSSQPTCGSSSTAAPTPRRRRRWSANAATFAAGPYAVPNVRIEATVVYTNNPPCGAMRGFGAVQTCFAHEAQMDKLAATLGIDPVELRLRNALAPGSVLPTGQRIGSAPRVREVIERCASIPLPPAEPALARDPLRLPGGPATSAAARGSGAASASRSASRTSATARASTTPPRRP